MSRKVIVTIDKVGRPTIDAQGFTGGSCKEKTEALVNAFTSGKAGTVEVVEKDEIHMTEGNSQTENLYN